jgi:hypothetical protein
MPMIPFMEKFQAQGARETRSILVSGGMALPSGEYGFIELYCNEPGCDCRRVMINVLRPETGWKKTWATIGYGWETADFYKKWCPLEDPASLQGPYLDPLNPQSEYSPILLEIFESILESPDYRQRIKEHYRLFRDAVDKIPAGQAKDQRFAGAPRPRRNPRHRA